MSPNLLTVVAEMVAKPGREDQLKQRLLALVEPTRKEDGCLQYDLHAVTGEAGRFVFYENWTSAEALERHLASTHFQAFLGVAGELLAGPPRVLKCVKAA